MYLSMNQMFQIMKDYSDILVKNIQRYVDKDEPCATKDVIGAYSLDVMTSTSFSVNIDSLNKPSDPFVIHMKKLLTSGLLNPLIILVGNLL
ncbi:cytochrome P450 3A30-like [Xenopus laevis]|uniref:Cytochrome P450 3A n=1 Tax=Xenopus laevis TaxID=8355 RepID=A0A8J1KQV9_XENLA|nr:cytochrome P450 3A30-like [Xenopus laevis]